MLNPSPAVIKSDTAGVKRCSQAASDLQVRYRSVFAHSPVGISYHQLLFNRAGVPVDSLFQEVNPAFVDLAGIDPVGRKATDVFPGIDRGRFDWIKTCSDVVRTGQSARFDYFSPYSHRWFDCVVSPLELHRFTVMVFDITKQKRVEQNLEVTGQYYEQLLTILDSIEAHVFVADMDSYEILYMNERMKQDFGGDRTGELCYQAFQNHQKPCSYCTNSRLLDEKGNPRGVVEWEKLHPVSGQWYMNYDRAVRWIDGRIVRIQIALNTTERKLVEQQLRQAQRLEAIGVLAGGIAHDFNNILSVILGYTTMALEEQGCTDVLRRDVEQIQKAGLRAKDLVRRILSFSQQSEENLRTLDLSSLVKEVVRMLRASFPATIRIHYHVSGKGKKIFADPTQIHQLLLNLCTNSLHAMNQTGELSISLDDIQISTPDEKGKKLGLEPGEYARISICDNGIGMPDSVKERIFDPFFTTKEDGKGTGLGLSIVHGVVMQHKGAINVESEPEKGTRFDVYLPLLEERPEEYEQVAISETMMGNETILVCDDEDSIVIILQKSLEKLGYSVVAFNDSSKALAAYLKNPDRYDLVITDMTMPQLTGIAMAKAIFAVRPRQPLIICTGYTDIIDRKTALEEGVSEYLIKPVSSRELGLTVRRILDGDFGRTHPEIEMGDK